MVTLAERARRLEYLHIGVSEASVDSDTAIHPLTGDPDIGDRKSVV